MTSTEVSHYYYYYYHELLQLRPGPENGPLGCCSQTLYRLGASSVIQPTSSKYTAVWCLPLLARSHAPVTSVIRDVQAKAQARQIINQSTDRSIDRQLIDHAILDIGTAEL